MGERVVSAQAWKGAVLQEVALCPPGIPACGHWNANNPLGTGLAPGFPRPKGLRHRFLDCQVLEHHRWAQALRQCVLHGTRV